MSIAVIVLDSPVEAEAMVKVKERFVVDDQGKKMEVVLPIDDYEKILKELEELESVRAFDIAKAEADEALPAEQVFTEIENKGP